MNDAYPVQLEVEYPDRSLNRLTTFFRLFTIIPIAIVLGTVSGGETWSWTETSGATDTTSTVVVGAGGILFAAPLLMILFRQKYPLWWQSWNRELLRFANRVVAYLLLMSDRTPPPTSSSTCSSTSRTSTPSAI